MVETKSKATAEALIAERNATEFKDRGICANLLDTRLNMLSFNYMVLQQKLDSGKECIFQNDKLGGTV